MDDGIELKKSKKEPLSRLQLCGHVMVIAFQCLVIGGIALYVALEASRLRRDVDELRGFVNSMQDDQVNAIALKDLHDNDVTIERSRSKRFVDMKSALLSGKISLKDLVIKKCTADVVFLVDSSGSIGDHWKTVTDFINVVATRLMSESKDTNIGIISFSSSVNINVPLGPPKNISAVIKTMPFMQETTRTDMALNSALDMINAKSRKDVPAIVVLLTDGVSDDKEETQYSARNLKDIGATLFAIGVANYELNELSELVDSDPDRLFTSDKFDDLKKIVNSLIAKSCKLIFKQSLLIIKKKKLQVTAAPTMAPTTTTTTTTSAPCIQTCPAGPPGVKGETGFQGIQGDKGMRGYQGFKGSRGDTGRAGIDGEKGSHGIRGEKGAAVTTKGDKGDKGDIGLAGEMGVEGIRGPPGETGMKGCVGSKGDIGNPGINGFPGIPGRVVHPYPKYQDDEYSRTSNSNDKTPRKSSRKSIVGPRGYPGMVGAPGQGGMPGLPGSRGPRGRDGHCPSNCAVKPACPNC